MESHHEFEFGTQGLITSSVSLNVLSSHVISSYGKELQNQGSAAASEMEIEKLKSDYQKSVQMVNQWKKMYESLHQFRVKELVGQVILVRHDFGL